MKRARQGANRSYRYGLADLPVDMLHEIARHDELAYRALLAVPLFARSLTVNTRADYWVFFGYGIGLNNVGTYWYKRVDQQYVWHRNDGPALEAIEGKGIRVSPHLENIQSMWYRRGKIHCMNGPAIKWLNGDKEWWQHGNWIRSENMSIIKKFNLLSLSLSFSYNASIPLSIH